MLYTAVYVVWCFSLTNINYWPLLEADIALDEQIIWYNMKKHMVNGFTSAFDLIKNRQLSCIHL